MGGRNSEHRMTPRGRGNTWVSEEKSGGHQAEARYKGYLKVRGEEEILTQKRVCTTAEEVHVRRLKTFSNESRLSELYAWLADRMALNQQGGQEE